MSYICCKVVNIIQITKLPWRCLFWTPLKSEYYRSMISKKCQTDDLPRNIENALKWNILQQLPIVCTVLSLCRWQFLRIKSKRTPPWHNQKHRHKLMFQHFHTDRTIIFANSCLGFQTLVFVPQIKLLLYSSFSHFRCKYCVKFFLILQRLVEIVCRSWSYPENDEDPRQCWTTYILLLPYLYLEVALNHPW